MRFIDYFAYLTIMTIVPQLKFVRVLSNIVSFAGEIIRLFAQSIGSNLKEKRGQRNTCPNDNYHKL